MSSDTARRCAQRIHAVEHRLLPEVVRELMLMRALISVYDKDGLDEFARGLRRARAASSSRAAARRRSSRSRARRSRASRTLTGFAGDARRPREDAPPADPRRHPRAPRRAGATSPTLEEHGIEPFDLVVVNLYPFTEVAARHGVARRRRSR